MHSSNPATNVIRISPTYIIQFHTSSSKVIGGEVDGFEILKAGEYLVERDINIRPGGKLTLEPGVTLKYAVNFSKTRVPFTYIFQKLIQIFFL